ncbi:MAG: transposase [Candidatus Moranbacteria bacterium]|nr:transposase [Candidatus Moranbacteria bacterium]
MSTRKIPLETNEYYHIYNRGVDKRQTFMNWKDYQRFFQSMDLFNTVNPIGSIYEKLFSENRFGGSTSKNKKKNRLIDLICYCLNPNHYHFVLKQIADKGIEKFMHRLSTGYTGYFNKKHKRSGVLFQGRYKAVHIDTNEQLLHVSVYVNLNNRTHQFGGSTSKLEKPMFLSSWDEYVGKTKFIFCQKDDVFGQFKSKSEYREFAEQTLPSILERKELLKEFEE